MAVALLCYVGSHEDEVRIFVFKNTFGG